LGLDYLDLYLMHWPMAFKQGERNFDGSVKYDDVHPTDTYLAMENMVMKGLTRDIGVSNFNEEQIRAILERSSIKPAMVQIECHPYFNQAKMLTFLRERDILFAAYSPLGSPDRPWASPNEPALLDNPTLRALADKHGKTSAQVALRWQLQRGVAVVPKSVTPSRIEANLDVYDFTLSEDEVDMLDSLDKGEEGRMVCPRDDSGQFLNHRHPHFPFK